MVAARPPDSGRDPADAARAADDASDGDEQAALDSLDLETVYRTYGERVSRWAARLAGPGFDLEDIVHDIFLVVQRRLPEFRGEAKLSTWLYEITVRVVQARRRQRRRRWPWPFGRTASGEPNEEGAAVDPRDQGMSALDALERREATAALHRFLDALDEKYRTAVILFELEGLPCREIAQLTGTSVENVWARVSRGREKLIQAFAAAEAEGEERKGR
jgi:RNA polymerase sigma-70 factor (ECF subfamily)